MYTLVKLSYNDGFVHQVIQQIQVRSLVPRPHPAFCCSQFTCGESLGTKLKSKCYSEMLCFVFFSRKKIQTTSVYIFETLFKKGVNSDVTISALGRPSFLAFAKLITTFYQKVGMTRTPGWVSIDM